MAKRKLTFAISTQFDLVPLRSGQVCIEGFEIEFPEQTPQNLFFAEIVANNAYDIGELPLSHYLIAKDLGVPLVGIPIFPSRFLPHLGMMVNVQKGIHSPADLVGKRVGSPDWGFNPAVWMRGALEHQYEISTQRMTWVESRFTPLLPTLKYLRSTRYLHEQISPENPGDRSQVYGMHPLLVDGEIDAATFAGAGMPPTESTANLFADPVREGLEYIRQIGAFPITTVVPVKEATLKEFPGLASALMSVSALCHSLFVEKLGSLRDGKYMGIPIDTLLNSIGVGKLIHGIEANEMAIRYMLQYCHEQGLIKKLYRMEDLFASV